MPRLLAGEDVLLIAPTGAGKTEAALLPVLSKLVALGAQRRGISALYITPLRALNRDMERRILAWGAKLGLRVEVRHGDTPQSQRRKQSAKPPDVLITTPETLQAILPAKVLRRHLAAVQWVVIDEVHQLAKDRRGIQLTVGLERLREVAGSFQRIGLSATVGNPQEVAALFGGEKPLHIIHATPPKRFEFLVEWPKPNDGDFEVAKELFISPEIASCLTLIRDAVETHRASLVFVNSRLNAELLGSRLPLVMEGVGVHHGSLPREARERMEQDLKDGKLKALVATSTLELGIDIGAVDQVLQYQSPRQTASLVQRVGRAGHDLTRVSKGTIISVGHDDALEAVAIIERARQGALEPTRIHHGSLDVLGHQIVGVVHDEGGRATDKRILAVVRRSAAYRDLTEEQYRKVADFLVHMGTLRREGPQLVAGRKARDYYFSNLSTIVNERTYPVIDLTTMKPVGILGEEEMVLRVRGGYAFVVRGRSWKVVSVGPDGQVYVNPLDDPTARLPGWQGQIIPVHWEVAQHTARLRADVVQRLGRAGQDEVVDALAKAWPVNRSAVRRLVELSEAHRASGAPLPTPDNLVIEAFDKFLCVHAPFGELVNETFGDLIEELLARQNLVRFWWLDSQRVLLELTAQTQDLDIEGMAKGWFQRTDKEIDELLDTFLNDHLPLGMYMKGPAERLGVTPRGLFVPSDDLASFEVRFKGTPVEDEAMREILLEHADLPRVKQIFREVRDGHRAIIVHKAARASPFAHPIVRRNVEVPEALSPEQDREQASDRMRQMLQSERVQLLCFGCGQMQQGKVVGELAEHPLCPSCASPVLGPLSWHGAPIQGALQRHVAGEPLHAEEQKELTRARQGADMVAVYGKKAVMALSVYGVGPQAAARILAKMHRDDKAFFRDLYEAKLRYVMTRGYWDKDRQGGGRPREPVGKPYAYAQRDGASTERRL